MRRFRIGVLVTSLGGAGILALGLVDCANPTQIVVEVFSDACPSPTKDPSKTIHDTGIAVSHPDEIDDRVPTALKSGCETPTGVGTLTIYPSGAKDDEVAIKVVGGVTTAADKCTAPDYIGCIAHRRIVRFIPNQSQHVIVHLDLACLNRTCANGQTCDQGVCKDEADILSDGGTVPDATTSEAGVVDAGPGPSPIDAAADACTGCKGVCADNKCKVECTTANGCTGELCAPTLPCDIDCKVTDACNDISCTTVQKCSVDCGNQGSSCRKVACNAKNCAISCDGNSACASLNMGGITIDAGDKGSLECNGLLSCATTAACRATTCELDCYKTPQGASNPISCPPGDAAVCVNGGAGCTDWNNPKQPN